MGNASSSTIAVNKPKSFSLVFVVFLGLFSLWTLIQFSLLFRSYNSYLPTQDTNAKNALSPLREWGIAMAAFFGFTLLLLILYVALGLNGTADLTRLVIIWLILMFIVNVILLGYGFYFLSVVVNSTDYSSTDVTVQGNANTLKNYIITLLAFTGGNLLTIIIALIYYYYFGTTSYRFGRFFGGEATIDEFFNPKDPVANAFGGPSCGEQYNEFKQEKPYVDDILNRYGKDLASQDKNSIARRALQKAANIKLQAPPQAPAQVSSPSATGTGNPPPTGTSP